MRPDSLERLTRHAEVSEKAIEKYLTQRARAVGLASLKYANPGDTGYPDRLLVIPGGRVVWVELKSRGCKPSKLQALRIASLRAMGHRVDIIDSKSDVDRLVNEITGERNEIQTL